MRKKVQLCLDLGNSETRGVVRAGFEGEKLVEHAFHFSNTFAPISDEYQLEEVMESQDYTRENSFVVNIANTGKKPSYLPEGLYVSGLIADNNYTSILSPPTTARPKHENGMVYLAIVKSIDYVINWLGGFMKSDKVATKRDIAKLVEFDIRLIVPPLQVREAKKVMAEELEGNLSYFDMFDQLSVNAVITNVDVIPEGLAGYLACVFSYSAKGKREVLSDFLSSRQVLILDIGAGTTDVVATNKGKIIETAKTTISLGGNKIISKVRARYNTRNKANLSLEAFSNVLMDATIKHGDKVVDVAGLVNSAKQEVAIELIKELSLYFETQNVDLNMFESLLVIGGGAVSDGTSTTIASLILEGIKNYVPEISLVDTSVVVEPPLGNDKETLADLRYFNLLGLLTFTAIKEGR